jgi:hypothetical protein
MSQAPAIDAGTMLAFDDLGLVGRGDEETDEHQGREMENVSAVFAIFSIVHATEVGKKLGRRARRASPPGRGGPARPS